MIKENKILIIIPTLKLGGGAEKIAALVGSRLYEFGYDVSFLTFSKVSIEYDIKGKYFSFNEKNPYDYGETKGLKKLFKTIKTLFSLFIVKPKRIKDLCKEHKIMTIISFLELCHLPVLLSKVLFHNNCKIIVTMATNPNFHYDKSKNLFRFLLWNLFTIRILFRKANIVIPVSKGVGETLVNYGIPKNKIKTIYSPNNVNTFLKMSNEQLSSEYVEIFKSSFVFINIGRLDQPKGQWLLIRSFKEVVKNFSHAKLVILGDGRLENELENFVIELKLEKNVFLLGVHQNIFPFIKNSNCFVFTSLWEGLATVLIEALSLSIPIISTDCKYGPREILCPELNITQKIEYPYLGKYGILTKPFPMKSSIKDAYNSSITKENEMLANLMIRMIEEEALRQQYSNGIDRAKMFDEKKIIQKWKNQLN